jgi:hypothetical protein
MEAVCTAETLVYYETTQCYIPQSCNLRILSCPTPLNVKVLYYQSYIKSGKHMLWGGYKYFLIKLHVPAFLASSPIKCCPTTRYEGDWGERRYSSCSFSTSALHGGERSASLPVRALVPGKGPPVPIVQAAGWAPEQVRTQRLDEKSFASAGDWTSIVRSSKP